MPIALSRDADNTYRLEIRGILLRSEFSRVERELASELERVGSVRLLCVLTEFEGWEPDADWNNLGFYMKYGDKIDRIAIVGDERWRGHMLIFAAADLRKGPVEFFPEHEMARAKAWLSA